MKKLKVDLSDLANAMESSFDEALHFYLDTVTGEVIPVNEEVQSALEREEGCPEWQADMVEEAKKILADTGKRYRSVPSVDSSEGYQQMVDFVRTVEDESLCNELWMALDGKGAFGHFKRVLERYPVQRERWFKFKDEKMRAEAESFLLSIGIKALTEVSQ